MQIDIRFTLEAIIPPAAALPSREIGAAVEFLGIVRETEGSNSLEGLHYEAYETMARRQLEQIFAAFQESHPCAAVCFIHRLGWVPVGEASLFIRVLAAHRREALNFLSLAVDQMKADVPIWKRV